MFSPFVLLMAAIGIEVGATTALPRTRGFHDLTWSAVVLGAYALSIWLLAVVVKQMSVSVAYAVWSGLGTAAIAAVGVVAFGERIDLVKLSALALIIVGVIVLNLHTPSDSHHTASTSAGVEGSAPEVAVDALDGPRHALAGPHRSELALRHELHPLQQGS
jgi:small multidrug resistance pump